MSTPPSASGLLEAVVLEGDGEQTDLEKIFEQLLDERNLSHLTNLTSNEVTAFSLLGPIAKKYELEFLQEIITENLAKRISLGRGGRKDFVKILSNRLQQEYGKEDHSRGFWGRRRV